MNPPPMNTPASLRLPRIAAIACAAIALSVASAPAATLVGEQVVIRFDLGSTPTTVEVGDGAEVQNLQSPAGSPWRWTADFTATGFDFIATTTEELSSALSFQPSVGFRSATPGLIPADLTKLTSTVSVVVAGAGQTFTPQFDLDLSNVFTSAGPTLTFVDMSAVNLSLFNNFTLVFDPLPIGSTIRWAGSIELGEPVVAPPTTPIPLPAAAWMLLAGLGALAALRRR